MIAAKESLASLFDLDYLRHWSIWLDIKILLRTVFAVTRDPNAY